MKKIFIGADHGGFTLKSILIPFLEKLDYEVEDCGALFLDPGDDYPEISFTVAEKVKNELDSFGILLCRSGGGVAIAANKVAGIRAVSAVDEASAAHARKDNDAQILVIGADFVFSEEKAKKTVIEFLQTDFSKEARHQRRINQIHDYEEKN
jgi:ribose 5-phosphate isomerase B